MTCIAEIHERSPLRVLDRSIHGGLARGELGVVCAGAGAGKTAFLVGVALDVLLRGCRVLHIALDQPVDRVRNYYDEILAELSRAEELEKPADARLVVERNRRIHAYQRTAFSIEGLARSLSFLRSHTDVHPDLIVVDGYDWSHGCEAEIASLRGLSLAEDSVLWMSATLDREGPVPHESGFPRPVGRYEALIDVLLRLKGADGTVHLSVLKGHGGAAPDRPGLDLDPTTLLLVRR
ncbi:MAG: AAA family ATPase [Acidobacteriia bacterium]|jgi:hypothetical protein|nr:AAA family ATPase [Terriglobia bacterium]